MCTGWETNRKALDLKWQRASLCGNVCVAQCVKHRCKELLMTTSVAVYRQAWNFAGQAELSTVHFLEIQMIPWMSYSPAATAMLSMQYLRSHTLAMIQQ